MSPVLVNAVGRAFENRETPCGRRMVPRSYTNDRMLQVLLPATTWGQHTAHSKFHGCDETVSDHPLPATPRPEYNNFVSAPCRLVIATSRNAKSPDRRDGERSADVRSAEWVDTASHLRRVPMSHPVSITLNFACVGRFSDLIYDDQLGVYRFTKVGVSPNISVNSENGVELRLEDTYAVDIPDETLDSIVIGLATEAQRFLDER